MQGKGEDSTKSEMVYEIRCAVICISCFMQGEKMSTKSEMMLDEMRSDRSLLFCAKVAYCVANTLHDL